MAIGFARRNPAFSQVLYVVPLEITAEDGTVLTEAGAAVNPGVLDGSDPVFADAGAGTLETPANGVSSNSRFFIPVNAPPVEPEVMANGLPDPNQTPASEYDYGNAAANQAAQRAETQEMLGVRSDAAGNPVAGRDGSSILGVSVYGITGQ